MTGISLEGVKSYRVADFAVRIDQMDPGVVTRIRNNLKQFGVDYDEHANAQQSPALRPADKQPRPLSQEELAAYEKVARYDKTARSAMAARTDRTDSAAPSEDLSKLFHALQMLRAIAEKARRFENTVPTGLPDWFQRSFDHVGIVEGNSTVQGTDGDDLFHVFRNGKLTTGEGDDFVFAYNNATISTGNGDDTLVAYSNSTTDLGEGSNAAWLAGNGTAYGGSGNDTFTLTSNGSAYGGAGNDSFIATANGTAEGGEGDDYIELTSNGTGNGGAGNDTLISYMNGTLSGGAGDDHLTGSALSTLSGGAGNDVIHLTSGATVKYGLGDGDDVITGAYGGVTATVPRLDGTPGTPRVYSAMKLTFDDSISREQVEIARVGDDVRISFTGAEGSITLKDFQGGAPTLVFADGSKLDVGRYLGGADLTA